MGNRNILLICILTILCGIIFWPTIYRYDKMTIGGNSFPVRMNRITGHTEVYFGDEWVSQNNEDKNGKASSLPPSEILKITGNADFLDIGDAFWGTIYNGSSTWTITEIIFRIVAKIKLEMLDGIGDLRQIQKYRHLQRVIFRYLLLIAKMLKPNGLLKKSTDISKNIYSIHCLEIC